MRLHLISTEDAWSDPASVFYDGDDNPNTDFTNNKDHDITRIFDKTELKLGQLNDRVAKLELIIKQLLKTKQSENHQLPQQ